MARYKGHRPPSGGLLCLVIAATLCAALAGCARMSRSNHATTDKQSFASGALPAKESFYSYPAIQEKLGRWRMACGPGRDPSLIRVVSLGRTCEGRDIYAMKISSNAAKDDREKPDILLMGGIHASEWIGIEAMMYFAERLLSGYGKDDCVTYIMDNAEIWIIPVVNPDGFAYSQRKSDDRHRLWRKNRRPLADGGIGVDLNRSFPYKWRLPTDTPGAIADDIGGSDDPDSRFYRGEPDPNNPDNRAFIEKETRALINLIDDPRHNFVMAFDYHSYCERILYPPGHSRDLPNKDMDAFRHIAGGMAQLINRQRGRIRRGILKGLFIPEGRYEALQAGRLYTEVCTGTSMDFFYEAHGLIALAVELSPGFSLGNYANGTGYKISAEEIVPVCEENFPAILMAIDWAIGPARLEKSVLRRRNDTDAQPRGKRLGPGEIEVTLVFSKPVILQPRYSLLGRRAGVRSVSLRDRNGNVLVSGKSGRWSKTRYANDTFTARIILPPGTAVGTELLSDLGAIMVELLDSTGLCLDLNPKTRAVYITGEGLWINYEKTRDHKPPLNHDELAGKVSHR